MSDRKSLGLYVHIPFCVKKCEYCDFLSMPAGREVQKRYVKCLLREIEYRAKQRKECIVDSIFIGGGTPSILHAELIEQILGRIQESFSVDADAEVTIECNPGTLYEEKVRRYKDAGVNRISLGLQSACDEELRLLGRIHNWEQFCQSVQMVKKYFDNWNVDIMSALPGQSVESYRDTLHKVLALQPTHISAYSLIIEEGTPFYERYYDEEKIRQQGGQTKILPDEETERAMYEMTQQILETEGYYRYEISNYAREGYESRHNNRYWLREEYLGLGLGASSCIENRRWHNVSDMQEYLSVCEKMAADTEDDRLRQDVFQLSVQEQMEETMFLGLRRMEGVNREAFEHTFGTTMESVYGDVMKELELQKLIQYSGKYVQLTQLGIDVSNYVLAQFLR